MKRLVILGFLAFLAMTLGPGGALAQPGPPGQGRGYYCPWMGGGQGPCWRGGHSGWYCPWMGGPQSGSPVAKPGKPLTAEQAKALVEQHISRNPNLKAGKVSEKDGNYLVDVVTKNGSLVDKIQVNKQTGWFRSTY